MKRKHVAGWLDQLAEALRPEDMDQARAEEAGGRSAADFLITERRVAPRDVLKAQSVYYKLPYISLRRYHPDERALALIPHDTARRFTLLPLFRTPDSLFVAVADPMDLQGQDYVRQTTRLAVEPVVASRGDIEEALNRHYLGKERSAEAMGAITARTPEAPPSGEGQTVRVEDADAPVIKLVNYILTQAVHLGASDVHLEPYPQRVSLRFRVDGILHDFAPPPVHLYRALVSRIKIISNLDISERRLPQDGRAVIKVADRDYDLRVSIIPNLHGEGVVIRILDPQHSHQSLTELGFTAATLARYERIIARPYGMVLVVGPTGSGKTTTLYSTLKHVQSPRRKIVTLEDPVEYQLDGITQIQIHADIGFTFAHGLRSVLRHDPDTVLVGEIRDLESAEIALRASLTGHLLFSTLHTNDAPQAVTRLIDMGVPPFLVLSSLLGILAQRLVRRLCPECKVRADPTPSELVFLNRDELPSDGALYRPVGCTACGNLGYKGRVAIHELLEITPEMRHLPPDRISSNRLREMAMQGGFEPLRQSAMRKLLGGITSVEEIQAVTTEE